MIMEKMKELFTALTQLIDATAANKQVEVEINQQRLKDWVKNNEGYVVSSDGDDPSWSDDIEGWE